MKKMKKKEINVGTLLAGHATKAVAFGERSPQDSEVPLRKDAEHGKFSPGAKR